jgi:hypothetical protein
MVEVPAVSPCGGMAGFATILRHGKRFPRFPASTWAIHQTGGESIFHQGFHHCQVIPLAGITGIGVLIPAARSETVQHCVTIDENVGIVKRNVAVLVNIVHAQT